MHFICIFNYLLWRQLHETATCLISNTSRPLPFHQLSFELCHLSEADLCRLLVGSGRCCCCTFSAGAAAQPAAGQRVSAERLSSGSRTELDGRTVQPCLRPESQGSRMMQTSCTSSNDCNLGALHLKRRVRCSENMPEKIMRLCCLLPQRLCSRFGYKT